jgi:hypothetical protein
MNFLPHSKHLSLFVVYKDQPVIVLREIQLLLIVKIMRNV